MIIKTGRTIISKLNLLTPFLVKNATDGQTFQSTFVYCNTSINNILVEKGRVKHAKYIGSGAIFQDYLSVLCVYISSNFPTKRGGNRKILNFPNYENTLCNLLR